MDNTLLEYTIEDLLIAALRKGMLLRLTSVGAPIEQEIIDSIVIEMSKDVEGFFTKFSETITQAMAQYWVKIEGGNTNE